ncbi:acyl-CoA/acyl-ACP dehydrogenase [Pseudomonas silvicola]|nr:acyl-CoA/acyl-ACP dehydrogenase [Pseudomonas silvicola]
MNFDFSAEQEQLRDQARKIFSKALSSARRVLETGITHDSELWASIVALGWPAAGIAEEAGGLGLSALEWCVVAEEAGRVLAPVPFASSVQMATVMLQQLQPCPNAHALLEALACGESIASVAFLERGQDSWTNRPSVRIVDGRLNGRKALVADAGVADAFIVSALDEQDNPGWWWVNARDAGVNLEVVTAIDRVRSHADLCLDRVVATRLGAGLPWQAVTERALNASAVLVAFEQLGTAEAALALTLDYINTRKTFNRTVASYQAVKHQMADLYVKLQLARSHCYYGAWALTEAPDVLPLAAAGARLAASDALNDVAEAAVELHGGIGFTWESDVQLFYRRARLLATQLGGRAVWSQRLVDALSPVHLQEIKG